MLSDYDLLKKAVILKLEKEAGWTEKVFAPVLALGGILAPGAARAPGVIPKAVPKIVRKVAPKVVPREVVKEPVERLVRPDISRPSVMKQYAAKIRAKQRPDQLHVPLPRTSKQGFKHGIDTDSSAYSARRLAGTPRAAREMEMTSDWYSHPLDFKNAVDPRIAYAHHPKHWAEWASYGTGYLPRDLTNEKLLNFWRKKQIQTLEGIRKIAPDNLQDLYNQRINLYTSGRGFPEGLRHTPGMSVEALRR